MAVKQSPSGLWRLLWKPLTSVKLTVAVLLTIAAAAVIGTVIPQNNLPGFYLQAYGEMFSHIMARLDLTDMYHSLWFQGLIVLLAVNILACSLDRLRHVWKIVFSGTSSFSSDTFGKTNATETVTIDAPLAILQKPYLDFLSRHFSKTEEQTSPDGLHLFAESGRFSRLGVYIVHFSILILLAGTLISSWFGFEGHVALPEGKETRHVFLADSDQTRDLGFTLRCDAFSVSFYESGRPKEYRSTLAVLENNREIMKKDILVNRPLRYRGINVFQSSYGIASAKNIALIFTSRKSGLQYHRTVNIEEPVTIPEGLGVFTITHFLEEYLFRGEHNVGQTLIGALEQGDHREMVALPLKFTGFDKMRPGDVTITVGDLEQVYYTGLRVTRDPGVPVVYAGFLLIIAGIFITFFLSHRTFCVQMTAAENKTKITILHKANKNRPAARRKAEMLVKKLTRLKTKEAPRNG